MESVYLPARPIKFRMKRNTEKKIDHLVSESIINEIDPNNYTREVSYTHCQRLESKRAQKHAEFCVDETFTPFLTNYVGSLDLKIASSYFFVGRMPFVSTITCPR